MELPCQAEADGRARMNEPLQIRTVVTLLRNSDTLEFRTELDNTVRHHRLRVLFPTGMRTDKLYTRTPFAMSQWDADFTNYANTMERETFVRPSQGITFLRDDTGALALYAKGLYEVAVSSDVSRTLALTLFRSFPAEVCHPTGNRLGLALGQLSFDYAIRFDHTLTPQATAFTGECWRRGQTAVRTSLHDGTLPATASMFRLEGESLLLSAVYRKTVLDAGAPREVLLLRVVNMGESSSVGQIILPCPAEKAVVYQAGDNLVGEGISMVGTTIPFHLRQSEIKTIAVLEKRS